MLGDSPISQDVEEEEAVRKKGCKADLGLGFFVQLVGVFFLLFAFN